jgi:hypothetical protein
MARRGGCYALARLVKALVQQVACSIPDKNNVDFLLTESFQPLGGFGVDLPSNVNEYQGYSLGVKAAVAYC